MINLTYVIVNNVEYSIDVDDDDDDTNNNNNFNFIKILISIYHKKLNIDLFYHGLLHNSLINASF